MEWNEFLITTFIVGGILLLVGTLCASSYYHTTLKYNNFQETIKDLNSEQKCIHICGFNFPDYNYVENYKFCLEKCDRISERENN